MLSTFYKGKLYTDKSLYIQEDFDFFEGQGICAWKKEWYF